MTENLAKIQFKFCLEALFYQQPAAEVNIFDDYEKCQQ